MPRDFEEHRYFCSLKINVPTEKFSIALVRYAKDVEAKMYQLVRHETQRRVGESRRLTGSTPFPRTLGLRVSPPAAERQSLTLAGVVPAFDVISDIRSRLGSDPVLPFGSPARV